MIQWQQVPGFFDFQDIYEQAVKDANDGDTLVEVGTFLGKSALFMAERIRDSGKRLKFYCVDKFDHKDWYGAMHRHGAKPLELPDGIRPDTPHFIAFNRVLIESGFQEYIRPMLLPSVSAAAVFPDQSLKFVYLDADHQYAGIRADIDAWLPKMAPGGTIAGHDYTEEWPGVIQAVNEHFMSPERLKQGLYKSSDTAKYQHRMASVFASAASWLVRL